MNHTASSKTASSPSALYLPIADYAVIGNLRTIALIGLKGSIDWCCLPHLDSGSVFGALLDANRGGRFSIAPAAGWNSEQRYWPETNILETAFDTAGGRLSLTDWMPLAGDIDGAGKSQAEPVIYRRLECHGSGVEVSLRWSPRLDYGRAPTRLRRIAGGFLASGAGDDTLALTETFSHAQMRDGAFGPEVAARFRLEPGEPLLIATRWDCRDARLDPRTALDSLHETAGVWRAWVRKPKAARVREGVGLDSELILRSEFVLRLLAHGDTGAIAAAATTSLPEDIGGIRNWDYRFSWLRDSSQLIETLTALDHHAEVLDFLHFIERCSEHRQPEGTGRVMYGLHGELDYPESTIDDWEGYRQSSPVRIGNGGFEQVQHDVYGDFLDSSYKLARHGAALSPTMRRLLSMFADLACDVWRQPDHGIWEIRGPKRHYLYSKLMVWVALDRAIRLADEYGLEGDSPRWQREREEVREAILRNGFSQKAGAFTQSFGSDEVDAANLMMPIMKFLPFEDPRIQATIERTIERLTENDFVYRYRVDDGLEGEEGAFLLMSFWLVDALAFSGRLDEAHQYFEAVLKRVNHVGLLSEQINPHSGELLGNFPQAFSHIGLIDSALHLAWAEQGGDPPR